MRRALRPKGVAVRGERPVPVHLQHRLLDEAVEHRRDAEWPFATRRLRTRRTGCGRRCPSSSCARIAGKCALAHAIDARSPLVALHLRQRLPQIVSLDNRFHRRPTGRPAFDFGFRRSGFGPFPTGASGFTRHLGSQGGLPSSFLPHARASSPFYLPFHRLGLRRITPPTMPSADFSAAITGLTIRSVRFRTRRRSPEVKIDRLHRTPAEFTTPVLDGRGLRDHRLARPIG
jgi:hypothetical protein